jgi:hypothetical protein
VSKSYVFLANDDVSPEEKENGDAAIDKMIEDGHLFTPDQFIKNKKRKKKQECFF